MVSDVIVVGLGTMGSATAHQLATRGLRVLGFDSHQPPHGHGSHAGGSRIIRLAYLEGAAYVPLLRRAYELWRELEAASAQRLLTTTGGLMLGRPDSAAVAGAVASAQEHRLVYQVLDATEVRREFPAFTPRDDEVACYEEVAGFLRPEAVVTAQLRLAERAGAALRYGTPVVGWSASGNGVTVRTADGEHHAGTLVICPGGFASRLLGDLGVPFEVERQVQHWWWPSGDPDQLKVGNCPVWIWERPGGPATYGFPLHEGSGGVKTAFHHGGAAIEPEASAAPATEDEAAAMRGWLTDALPGVAGEWLRGVPCRYTNTPDSHFVVGCHPAQSRVAVAGGFSGHGFKFASVVGEILADLATAGTTSHDITLFDPTRFSRRE